MLSTTHVVTRLRRRTMAALCALLTALAMTGLTALPAHAAAQTFAYVANLAAGTVSVVDTATNAVTATVTVGNSPAGAAASPDGSRVYITNNGGGTVSVIDTATNTVTATITVGTQPGGRGGVPGRQPRLHRQQRRRAPSR